MITLASHIETSGGGFTQYVAKCSKAISRRTLNDARGGDELRGQCASSTAVAAAGNTRPRQKHSRIDSYHHEKVVRDNPRDMEETPSPRYPDIAPRMTHQSREKLEHTRTVQGTANGKVGYENGVGKWTRREVLGRGAHGVVYRGVTEDTLESIAVKQIQTSAMGRSQLQVLSQAAKDSYTFVPAIGWNTAAAHVSGVEPHLRVKSEIHQVYTFRNLDSVVSPIPGRMFLALDQITVATENFH